MPRSWQWTEEEQAEAEKAHAEYYLPIAAKADKAYLQGGENALRGLLLFDNNQTHIRAGQQWAAGYAENDGAAARLCNEYPSAATDAMDLRLGTREQIRWLEQAARAADKLGDKRGEGSHLGNLGLTYYQLGDDAKAIAYYSQALEIAREVGDKRNEGNWLGSLGIAHSNLGEAKRAIEYHEKALIVAREIGDKRSEGNYLGNLGLAYLQFGDLQKAIECHTQALAIATELGDKRLEGIQLGNLGLVYYQIGKARKAIEYGERALVIAREIGDRRSEGSWLGNLGLAYYQIGDLERAIEHDNAALQILEQIESVGASNVRTVRQFHVMMSRHRGLYALTRFLFPVTRMLGRARRLLM